MKRSMALIAAAIVSTLTPAVAAPDGLLNKTVHISWFQQTPGNEVGTGASAGSAGRNVTLTLYVSSAGRVFAKAAGQTKRFSGERSIGPEGTSFRAEGTRLVGTLKPATTNGATRVAVTFDGSFQSCTVQAILASEGGRPLEWQGLNGKRYIATGHPTVSNQSCSVSAGNGFAG